MSVINSVLKDLEAHEARFTPIELDGHESSLHPSGRRNSLIAVCALAAMVAIFVWLFWRMPAPAAVAALAPAIEPSTLADRADPMASIEPVAPRNRIVGLQLRETGAGLHLEFALRERPVAYLRHRDGNRFGYHLRAVDSEIEAPRIDNSDWLETLALAARDGGIDVDFVTAAGILVETRQARVDGEPVWTILLRRPPPVVSAAAAPDTTMAAAAPTAATIQPVNPAANAVRGSQSASDSAPPVASDAVSIPGQDTDTEVDTATEIAAAEMRLDIRSTDPRAPARNQLQFAVELINAGRSADAETLLESLLDGSEDRAAREHLLALYQLSRRPRDFARLARASAERYPAAATFVIEHARVLMQSAEYAEVVALLSPAAELDAAGQALLAAAYQRLDRHADAIRHYEFAVAGDGADARHWIGLGISQEHAATLEDALNSYRIAARVGPPSERLRAFVAQRMETLEGVLQ